MAVSAESLRSVLASGDSDELLAVAVQLQTSTDADRLEIVCESDCVGQTDGALTLGAGFHLAVARLSDKTIAWDALASLTDIRSAPLRDMVAQFGQPELMKDLVAGLSEAQPMEGRKAACRCCKNLARVPRLRALLEETIVPLVHLLSHANSEFACGAAAALCNVACTASGRDLATKAGAVPLVLAMIGREEDPVVADDFVACLGVLTSGPAGAGADAVAGAVLRNDGVAPLLHALRLGHTALMATTLDVISHLVLVLGPSSMLAMSLVNDIKLGREDLPRLATSPEPEVRDGALKLVALLWDVGNFQASFVSGGGSQALQAALELEPPAGGSRRGKGVGKLQICAPGCADASCCFPGLTASQGPPSRREIAEQLLMQISRS